MWWENRCQIIFALVAWVFLVLLFSCPGQAQDSSAFLTVDVQPSHLFVVYQPPEFQTAQPAETYPQPHPRPPAIPPDDMRAKQAPMSPKQSPVQSPVQAPVFQKQVQQYADCNSVQKVAGYGVQQTYDGWFGGMRERRAARRANRGGLFGGRFRGGC